MYVYQFQQTNQYILTVRGQDLNGSPLGNTGTGTVTINVLDVNDHPPTLEKEQVIYSLPSMQEKNGIH